MSDDMNDEFLHRLRAQPSKKFLSTLKARLDRQSVSQAKARRTLFHTAILAALIGGSAVAVAFAVLRGAPSSSRAVHVAAAGSAQAASANDAAARSGGGASMAGEPRAGGVSPVAVLPAIAGEPAGVAQSRNSFVIAGPTAIVLNAQEVARHWGGPSKVGFTLTSSAEALAMFCHAKRDTGTASYADIAGASRRILASELETCKSNGVTHVAELRSGYEAVVLVRSKLYGAPKLSARDIFLALAAQVPDPNRQQVLIKNPYRIWSAIDGALLEEEIEVLGPPASSATAAAFRQTLMEAGCSTFPWLAALKQTDSQRYERVCRTLRDDGVYRDKGGKLQEHLETYPNSLALLDFREAAARSDTFAAASVDGVEPVIDSIFAENYAGSRAMFMYVNTERARMSPLAYFVSVYRSSLVQSGSISTLVVPLRQADPRTNFEPLAEMKF